MRRLAGILFLLAFFPRLDAAAEGLRTSGFLAAEARWFSESPQYNGQSEDDVYSYVMQPEFSYKTGKHIFRFVPFYRDDSIDEQRSHGDVRELYWQYQADDSDLTIGINKVYWGVTESRHLVDIINQTDAVEDIDGEDKLGQPMIRYSKIKEWGTVTLFILPGFRERTFAGVSGRFRSPLIVDTTRASYQSAEEDNHIDYALRYSHTLGNWDMGVSYFYGTSREPRLTLDIPSMQLLPQYDLIRQWGTDIQYTRDAWLWKFEAIVRQGQGKTFLASAAGFEYTFYQVAGSARDLGVLLEYLYDERDANAPATDMDDDIFAGFRLAFNDTDDTSILAGVLMDRDGNDRFFNLEAERRITDHLKIELRARLISNTKTTSLLHAINKDDYLQVQLQYHF